MPEHIVLLLDDRAGNNSQVLGIGRVLQQEIGASLEAQKFAYTRFGKLPNFIRGRSLVGITPKPAPKNTPDYIISAGRRSAPVARGLKQQYPNTFLCHMMWPDVSRAAVNEFDLIALPTHDEQKYGQYPNTIFTQGAPGKILPEDLTKIDTNQFAALPKPHISVLVGGSSKHGEFTVEHAAQLATQLQNLHQQQGGSVLVTTSRRSGVAATNLLKEALKDIPHYFYDWQSSETNPYQVLLATADLFVVTEDSVSMLSECLVSGKPVHLFKFDQQNPFSPLHNTLIENGNITILGEGIAQPYTPIVPAEDIVRTILSLRKQP